MKKTILLSSGKAPEMTFEEVKRQFQKMLFKEVKRANNKFMFNQIDEEDFLQEMDLELWRAYRDYDASTGNCFSTYLFHKLRKGVRNVTHHRYSMKNQNNGILSMNAGMGEDDLKLEDMFSIDDTSSDNMVYNDLTAIIRSNVSEDEEEILQVLLNKKDFSVVDYAKKYGITRQAANQRVKKLQRKLQKIVARDYLEITI